MILREARKNKVTIYAPCSSAWQKVRTEHPDLELHNLPDDTHPGTLGNYLNMCCFYAAFTGTSPQGLPVEIEVWPRFGAFNKAEAQNKVAVAQLDDYHIAMPNWMQAISIMRWKENIDPDVALYLQNVAWDTWQEKMNALN